MAKPDKKNLILETVGKLFYEKGFKRTTLEDIAKEASVPKSLVTYYYKKNELLSEFYLKLLINISDEIEKQVGHLINNHLQRHIILTNIFYRILLSDDRYIELYRELLLGDMIPQEAHMIIRKTLREIIKEFSIKINNEVFENLLITEYAARRELFLINCDKMSSNHSEDLINFFATISARLAGIELIIIEENTRYANLISDKVDSSSIKFLRA